MGCKLQSLKHVNFLKMKFSHPQACSINWVTKNGKQEFKIQYSCKRNQFEDFKYSTNSKRLAVYSLIISHPKAFLTPTFIETSANANRVLSRVGIIKSKYSSTMGNERLNWLVLITIDNDANIYQYFSEFMQCIQHLETLAWILCNHYKTLNKYSLQYTFQIYICTLFFIIWECP